MLERCRLGVAKLSAAALAVVYYFRNILDRSLWYSDYRFHALLMAATSKTLSEALQPLPTLLLPVFCEIVSQRHKQSLEAVLDKKLEKCVADFFSSRIVVKTKLRRRNDVTFVDERHDSMRYETSTGYRINCTIIVLAMRMLKFQPSGKVRNWMVVILCASPSSIGQSVAGLLRPVTNK